MGIALESPAGSSADPARFPFKIWLIAFLGWTFDFYDLILFSFLLAPMGQSLNLTREHESVLLGIALGASGIGGIAFGYLADRFGRKRVMTWTILLYSAGTALTALAVGPLTLALYRLITGLGVGGEWAVGHALVAESSPGAMRGRAAAMLQSGEPIGVGVAAVVGFLVAPWIGWRAVYAISSASAIVALAARQYLPESRLWEPGRDGGRTPLESLRWMARRKLISPLLKGWVLGVLKLGTYWTCYIWLPRFMREEFHQPIDRSVLWILTSQLGQLLGMVAFGIIADRFGRRYAFTLYSLLTAGALGPLAFRWQDLIHRPALFWTALFVLGLGSGCTAGFGALMAELFPTEVRNFAMGTAYNCARGVQFFAPIVVAHFVALNGVSGGLGVPLVLALATAAWVWVLPETRERDLACVSIPSPTA